MHLFLRFGDALSIAKIRSPILFPLKRTTNFLFPSLIGVAKFSFESQPSFPWKKQDDRRLLMYSESSPWIKVEQLLGEGKNKEAFAVFQSLRKEGKIPLPRTFSEIGQAFHDDQKVLLGLFQDLKRLRRRPPTKLITLIIKSFIKQKEMSDMRSDSPAESIYKLFSELKQINFHPSEAHYILLFRVLAEKKDVDTILDHYSRLEENRIVPSAEMYKILLPVIAETKDFSTLKKYIQEMEANVSPNERLLPYHNVIQALSQKDCDYALEFINYLHEKDVRLNSSSYNLLLRSLRQQGYPADVIENLVSQMQQTNVLPNQESYESLIVSLIHDKNFSEAMEVFNQCKALDVPLSRKTWNSLLSACKDAKAMESLFHEMLQKGFEPDTSTFNTIMDRYFKMNMPTQAQEVLPLLQSYHLEPDVITFTILMNYFANVGALDKAEEIFKQMVDSRDVATYNTIILAFSKAGQSSKAMEYLELMISDNVRPSLRSFIPLVVSATKNKDFQTTLQLWKRMNTFQINMDRKFFQGIVTHFGKRDLFLAISKHFPQKDPLEKVSCVYSELRTEFPETNSRLAVLLLEYLDYFEHFDAAIKWFEKMHTFGFSLEINEFNIMIKIAKDTDNTQLLLTLIGEMDGLKLRRNATTNLLLP